MTTDTTVAIAYHSGYGHTAVLAEAVGDGVAEAGARTVPVPVDTITPEQWAALDAADAIVFGAPTYLGSASAAFHVFAESTSGRWAKRAWTGKVASGFTVSGSMSGDKLHTLQYFSIFAAQHGMHWVNLDLLPGWSASTASEHDLNRLGITLGTGAQTDTDRGPEEVSKADAQTAFHLGARVARVAAALTATPVASAVR
ncbi:flavodoxin family protein [Streptomyces africanus]|uniref:flavodoxin family protein n=1 Tax=Streptomyces africanus TaxID=231024 RepID=UPI000A3A88AE|nr:flavodoxin family protein [Streptomyces africanus]